MKHSYTSLSLIVKSKHPAVEYQHKGQTFVEGRAGSDFDIKVTNHSNYRVLAIISVDGLSVIDGEVAGQNSPGYIVEANSTISIPGWKLNGTSVAKFTFSGKKESYSQLSSGTTQNCGVIGVMVWSEQPQAISKKMVINYGPPANWGDGKVYPMSSIARSNDPTMAMAQAASTNNIGTQFGEQAEFNTALGSFVKGAILETLVLYYDDAQGLKARGIKIERNAREALDQVPNPFPAGNCTPPSGWGK